MNKEVYGVLIPLKFSNVSEIEDSRHGDYQYHAISFVLDGSVNYKRLKEGLEKVARLIDYKNKIS